ncbi:MAG: LysM peptidoglycan-binding domain-containing protein [Gemmatimonadaceae bacterium]
MNRSRFRSLALFVVGLSAASPLWAQAEAPGSHVVNKGETLWSLANKYLGDPFLWPEIYRLNTDKIQDPHWIYPGETLALPAAGAVAASSPRPAAQAPAAPAPAAPAPAVAAPTVAAPAMTTPAVPAAAPAPAAADTNPAPTIVVDSPPPAPRPQQPHGMTVFNPEANRVEHIARASLNLRPAPTAVRAGEFLASPFVWSAGGPSDAGALEEATEAAGINMTAANRPLQYLEPVFVRLPKGGASLGDRFLVYRLDSLIEGQGQVLVPTGVVKLIAPGANGRSRAQLVQKFEDVFEGQALMPLDTLRQAPGVFPKRVEFGLATKVSWLNYNPVLPGAGSYLVLSATAKDGLVPGDQVTLLRDRGTDEYGADLPPEAVAVAQVTRVTPYGSGAIVLQLLQAGVAQGMRARVTAKMP